MMKKGGCFIGTPGGTGAVASHFAALGEELARRGHEVKMLVPRGASISSETGANPEFLSWPSSRPTKLADALFLARLIIRCRPELVFANFAAVNWMLLVGWLARVPCRIAFYHTLSSQIEKDTQAPQASRLRMQRFRKRQVFRLATHIVANSKATQRDARCTYRLPVGICTAQALGLVDPADRLILSSGRERQDLVVCTGRLHASKGQDVLINALALNPQAWGTNRVLFLGSGPRLEPLRQLARERGVADYCTFAGAVSHAEVLSHMSRAKAVVVPSHSEAFGFVNVEALAVGTPVIASAVGGIPEVVRDGVDGLLVPPADPESLADALLKLLGNPSLREQFGRSGRQRFLDSYELSKVVVEQANWLESIRANHSE
jgi:glycosyltransferase involved in cell wall biosynthesis